MSSCAARNAQNAAWSVQAYSQFEQQLTTRPAVQQPPGAMQDYTAGVLR
jgi:hypothetical protein